jgi:hypothetical protein
MAEGYRKKHKSLYQKSGRHDTARPYSFFASVKKYLQITFINNAWFHFFVITILCLLIFGNTNGEFGVEGDDVFMLSPQFTQDLFPMTPYVDIMSKRGYLTPSYRFIVALMGQSTMFTHIFFLILYIASGFLLYFLAKKLFSATASLFAALFFLAYTGKYEVIPVISGGLYIFVITIFIISSIIALSTKFNLWTKSILITFINWLTVHFYEVLLVTTPLYPIITIVYRKFNNKKIFTFDLIATFFPLVMGVIHTWLLGHVGRGNQGLAIWQRVSGLDYYSPLVMANQVILSFYYGLDAVFGARHLYMLKLNLGNFRHYLIKDPWFAFFSVIFFFLLILFIYRFIFFKSKEQKPKLKNIKNYLIAIIASLYLIFLTPVVSFPIIRDFVPSRFTYLSSVGISLLIAALIDMKYYNKYLKIFLPFFAGIIFIEALSFSSIIQQYQKSADFDYNIRNQIKSFNPDVKTFDTIFLSYPMHPYMIRFWHEAPSKIDSGGIISPFLIDYNLLYQNDQIPLDKRLIYAKYRRDLGDPDPENYSYLLSWYPDWKKNPKKIHPFYADSEYKIYGIRSISVTDSKGKNVDSILFPAFNNIQKDKLIDVKVNPVAIDMPFVDNERKITIVYYDSSSDLLIEGEMFPNDPPFTAVIKENGKKISSIRVENPGKFTWRIAMSSIKENTTELTLSNQENFTKGKRVIWKVHSVKTIDSQEVINTEI